MLATLSLVQGFVDVVLPSFRSEEPFRFLFATTEAWGPPFFIGYVFVHNLGLACLVPGYGFVAAWVEKRSRNRQLIAVLLAGSVIISLLVALQYILFAHNRFDLRLAIPLYVGEAVSVLTLTLASAAEVRAFRPLRQDGAEIERPFRNLGFVIATTASLLVLLATIEAWAVLA